MYDRPVASVLVNFGTSGTTTLGVTTATSNPVRMGAQDYTVSLTCWTTGTSGVGGSVVWQGSNDSLGWIPLGTLSSTATYAGTETSTYGAAGLSVTANRYAYARAVPSITGTGLATVRMAF